MVKEEKNNLEIVNLTKGRLPSLPFADLKEEILGKNYSLSIAFVEPKTSQEINKKYRKKDYATNVLSFSLSKTEGEILLCPSVIKKETEKFDRNFRELLGFLVIHGMLHLIGMEHSSRMKRARMEKEENKYDQKYFNRNRRRLLVDQSGGRRVFKRRKIS
jgi:rRNA maturation RNase YbeY